MLYKDGLRYRLGMVVKHLRDLVNLLVEGYLTTFGLR